MKSEWVSGIVDRCEGKMESVNGIFLLKAIPEVPKNSPACVYHGVR